FGEARKIIKNLLRIRMENVRAIFVDQYTGVIEAIVRVATNMRPPIDEQNRFARTARQALRQHTPRVARAHNQIIKRGDCSGMREAVAIRIVTVSISILHAMTSFVGLLASASAICFSNRAMMPSQEFSAACFKPASMRAESAFSMAARQREINSSC